MENHVPFALGDYITSFDLWMFRFDFDTSTLVIDFINSILGVLSCDSGVYWIYIYCRRHNGNIYQETLQDFLQHFTTCWTFGYWLCERWRREFVHLCKVSLLSLPVDLWPLRLLVKLLILGIHLKRFDNMFIMIQRLFLAFEKSICLG